MRERQLRMQLHNAIIDCHDKYDTAYYDRDTYDIGGVIRFCTRFFLKLVSGINWKKIRTTPTTSSSTWFSRKSILISVNRVFVIYVICLWLVLI